MLSANQVACHKIHLVTRQKSVVGSWEVGYVMFLADFPGRYIPGMKCFRPVRSLVTLKFYAIDNIFHIFFCCQKLRGGGGQAPWFLTRGGGQCPLAPPPPPSPPPPPPPPGSAYVYVCKEYIVSTSNLCGIIFHYCYTRCLVSIYGKLEVTGTDTARN